MSAHSTALVPCSPAAAGVADHASLQVMRFDQWIGEIEEHIGDLEGHIRELSLAGAETGPESFNLQKLELLLEIAREAKARI
jgi:predicted transposase YdaD